MGAGFKAVISTDFADIFRNNALKNGLLPIIVDRDTQQQLFSLAEEDPSTTVSVDVEAQTMTLPDGRAVGFPLDGFSKYCLLNGVDQLGYLLALDDEVRRFRSAQSAARRDDGIIGASEGALLLKRSRDLKQRVAIYDTTLRDGSQREGISFSVADKMRITMLLDELGVDYIEGGWPGSNPKDVTYFDQVRALDLAALEDIGLRLHAPQRHSVPRMTAISAR